MVDRELNVVPAMADNMRVSSDGLEYLFRLSEGVSWSDGEPVTAEDFVYAWTNIREERAVTAFLLEDIESATALDDRTLEVRLREPRTYFPYILAATWAYPRPKHAVRVARRRLARSRRTSSRTGRSSSPSSTTTERCSRRTRTSSVSAAT